MTVTNTGVAPIYHDAFLTVNGVRSARTLKGLLPGESRTDEIPAGGESPKLTIESDRLVAGQSIDFEADLKGDSARTERGFGFHSLHLVVLQ